MTSARMGDRLARADITETWVLCADDDCGFEGDVSVEWLSRSEGEFVCPSCGFLQTFELD